MNSCREVRHNRVRKEHLCNALVDDIVGYFSKTIDICLAAAIVTAFYSVVEQTIDGVIVVLVIFCSIDTTLSGNGVCTTGRITDTENFNIIAELSQRGSCRCTAKACTNNVYWQDLQHGYCSYGISICLREVLPGREKLILSYI